MNNIINSSGVYDINSYNSISNNTTILSTFNVSGSTILNKTTINNFLYVSVVYISRLTPVKILFRLRLQKIYPGVILLMFLRVLTTV